MNKKLLTGLLAALLIIGGGFVAGAAGNDDRKDETRNDGRELMTTKEVKELIDSTYGGEVKELELERNHRTSYYEVELVTEDEILEVDVDAYTGQFLSVERKLKTIPSPSAKQEQKQATGGEEQGGSVQEKNAIDTKKLKNDPSSKSYKNASKILPAEDAIKIAEGKTGGKVTEIEREYDDGIWKYEIELNREKREIEIKMDAHSGTIIKIEYEDMDHGHGNDDDGMDDDDWDDGDLDDEDDDNDDDDDGDHDDLDDDRDDDE